MLVLLSWICLKYVLTFSLNIAWQTLVELVATVGEQDHREFGESSPSYEVRFSSTTLVGTRHIDTFYPMGFVIDVCKLISVCWSSKLSDVTQPLASSCTAQL